ncbi:hypothetical protein V8C35DRAFT_180277 [Trichoderma chlorosporum]
MTSILGLIVVSFFGSFFIPSRCSSDYRWLCAAGLAVRVLVAETEVDISRWRKKVEAFRHVGSATPLGFCFHHFLSMPCDATMSGFLHTPSSPDTRTIKGISADKAAALLLSDKLKNQAASIPWSNFFSSSHTVQ